ncbi:MAG: hypothetical protein AAF518_29095 [Spirochaetota bacterium]
MPGVNYELFPIVRMTTPKKYQRSHIENWEVDKPLFTSWILLGCFLPWDLHFFQLQKAEEEKSFNERSSSLTQKIWHHDRILRPLADSSCELTDKVNFIPRVAFLGYVMRPIFHSIFKHRHKRLVKKFGSV